MTVEPQVQTEADQRVEDAFGHEPHCHVDGCPGAGRCVEADRLWLYGGGSLVECDTTHCTCITAAIKKVVREERALVLEHAAEAFWQGNRKKTRMERHVLSWARRVRDGEA